MSESIQHGGNIRSLAAEAGVAAEKLLDFSANINPLGPPAWLRPVISAHIGGLVRYPDPDCATMLAAAATHYGVPVTELAAGNGTEDLLCWLPFVLNRPRAVIPVPAYVDYAKTAAAGGMIVETLPLRLENGFRLEIADLESCLRGDEVVYLGHPNNPTGVPLDVAALRPLIERHPETWFVIDEAFADFAEEIERFVANRQPNVVVLLSLTKHFAIPGLRAGLAAGPPELMERLRARLPEWSVNSLAQAVATEALADAEYITNTRSFVRERRAELEQGLAALPGLRPLPGVANFLLVEVLTKYTDAQKLADELLRRGIAIRTCMNFPGLGSRYFRVAVRTEVEQGRLLDLLADILAVKSPTPSRKRRTGAIMFQGTSSNAGKSVLTAALCRIFHQDGLSVAPFKSQNMSLNSFVTRDGLEMGRAQVVQAQACRMEPDARMNPILLKPNSTTGSQVIVMGKPVGNMKVGEYIRYKPQAFAEAKRAYDSLAAAHDVMVLEGAGSPAEVNLKRHDIVNMGMARYANAPVLLVGDIDRGGVYASFVGTMEVLDEAERAMVAGFVVNRFRGQESLLADAHSYVLRHTGVPVLGVVPYLTDLGLPEEDSVTFKEERGDGSATGDRMDIAMIDLPHISNFTDIDALRIEPDVRVRIVRRLSDLGTPDAVILPGSKHVAGDLAYLRESGLAAAVLALAEAGGTEIMGICGGYQMLGKWLADPLQVESSAGPVAALGLLDLTTVMAVEKTLRRVECVHAPSGHTLRGYEIHHGRSESGGSETPLVTRDDGEVIGSGRERVWGSYVHGIFDADGFRRWFIDRLRARRGMEPLGSVVAVYDIEEAFDRLAAVVRERLDMDRIYQLIKP